MINWILVFLATALYDFCWAIYTAKVQQHRAAMAGLWSMGIYALGAGATIGFVNDTKLLIPACIGAFIGTYAGVMWNKLRS